MPANIHATKRIKYEAIFKCKDIFSVRKMCKVLGVRESGYYSWKKGMERRNQKRQEERSLIESLEKIFLSNKKIYGYRKLFKAAIKERIQISEYKVRKLMKQSGMYPERVEKIKPKTNSKESDNTVYSENIVNRNFDIGDMNKVWAGDITYIKTQTGWTYLSIVMDLFNREIIGYSISKNIDTELVKSALGNAISRVNNTEGIIFHSDRGSQYRSKGYKNMLDENKIISSMSKAGCPYDNSCVESFFATLKKECIYRKSYATIEEIRHDVFEYIELFYNRKRMHSVLGYMSPVEYRLANFN